MKNLTRTYLFLFFLCFSPSIWSQCSAGQTYNTYCYGQMETNNVAFEFCPNTGEIAQSEIIGGFINNLFPPNIEGLSVYEGLSGTGTSGTLLLGPINGAVAGNIITASAPDLCLIFVTNSNSFFIPSTCQDGVGDPLEVCSESLPGTTVTFTALDDLCNNAGVQTGLSGGSPSGGVYSGAGVTDNGDGTYDFDPIAAGIGIHILTYTNGSSATDNVEVFVTPTVTFTAPADLCIDAGSLINQGGGAPTGGVYSGPGVTDNGNGTYNFNAAIAGLGVHTITYTETLCGASASDDIEVLAACGCPQNQTSHFHCGGGLEIDLVIFEVCPSAGMAAEATITAGTYNIGGNTLTVYEGASGSGTSGTIKLGPATGDLTGTVVTGLGADQCLVFVSNSPSGLGCQQGFETALAVCGEDVSPSLTFTAPEDLCIDEGIQMGLSGGLPTGGVYSGDGVMDDGNGMTYSFDPTLAGAGTHTITYTVGASSAMDEIEIFATGTAGCILFTALDDLCIDAGVQTMLGGGSPSGGIYSGSGVMDDGNGISYNFNPAIAGAGTHTLAYEIPGLGQTTDEVVVFALPIVTFSAPGETCENGEETLYSSLGTPSGGVYSGPGVMNIGDGINFTFDPGVAGSGMHTLVYTLVDGNGCMNSASDMINVIDATPATFTALADLCINAGIQTNLSGGSPNGGVYSGNGVTDNGNGMTYTFNPAAAGVGTHTISYMIAASGSCPASSAMDDVEVFDLPEAMLAPPADLCINAGVQTGLSGGTPTGGVYSGTGVMDDGNGMTYTFDPAAAGVGVHDVTYTVTEDNCSNITGTGTSFTFDPSRSAPAIGETFYVDVVVTGFTDFISFQYSVEWDPTLLAFEGISGVNLPNITFGTTQSSNGVLLLSWFDPLVTGDSQTDGTSIFSIDFQVVSSGPASADIEFSSTPLMIEIIQNQNGNLVDITNSTDFNKVSIDIEGTCEPVCSANAMETIEVFALPVVSFTALPDLCIDAGEQIGLGGGVSPEADGIYSGPGVTDDGNGMTYTFDPADAGVGVHTLTYSYTDENGCTNSADDMVEVFALPIVTFTAPALDVCIDDPVETGLGGGMPTGGVYNGTGVTDDANGMTFSFNPAASAPAGGDVTVTYTFTDGNGCSASADDDIFVDPICCELIVTCPPMSLGTITCNDAIPTAATDEASFEALGGDISDDPEQCGTLVITHLDIFDPPTDICNGRTMTRTYTIADDLTSVECVQTLMISAPAAPMITCPTGMIVECLSDISVDPDDATVTTDCSQGFNTIITGPIQNGDSDCPETTYTYTYTVTDDCGRTAACEQVFTIQNDAPTITCPADMTVECLSDISLDPADAEVATSCTLGSNTVITGPVQNGDSDCPETTYTYTYTVTDDCGRMAACEQVFTIQNDAPTITCPADMTVECLSDISLDPADAEVNTSCTLGSNIVITGPVQNGDSDCPETTYTYTYTVTDDCGRMAACEQVFTIQNDAPTITCPADMTVECLSDISLDSADAEVSTSCTLGSNTVITGPVQNGDSDCPETTYTYTYTVTDDCGRTAACEQVFTIENEGPMITCPADEIVECFTDITVDPADAIVVTSCTLGFNTVITGPIQNGQSDCPGTTYTYTYTTTDDCGRTAECKQVFTIENLAPIIVCPADEVVTCVEDIVVDPNNLEVTTSCGMSFIAYVKQPLITGGIPGCDGTVYTYIYKVVDACGRVSQCEQQFLIQNNAPTVTVPAGNIVECFDDIVVSESDATVVADCAGDYVINVLPVVINGPMNCPGTTYTYTYRVKDFCNRIVEVDRVFTNGDNQGPIITSIPLDVTTECATSPSLSQFQAESSCGGGIQTEVSDPVVIGTPGCPGSQVRYTYTATDECGRTATHVQIFTIQNAPPVVNCPETLQIFGCEDGTTDQLIDAWLASVTANASCGGSLTVSNNYNGNAGVCIGDGFTNVIFFATDQCGRTSSCVGTIIIIDTEAPIIYQNPQEVLVPCNGATQFIFDNWLATQGGAEAIDGCWGENITWSMNPANPVLNCDGGPQAIIVEFIATDGCGNSSAVTGVFNTKLPGEAFACPEGVDIEEEKWATSFFPDLNCSPGPGIGFDDNFSIVPATPGGCLNSYWTGGYCFGEPVTSIASQEVLVPLNINTLRFEYLATAPDACNGNEQQEFSFIRINGVTVWVLQHITANDTYDFCNNTGGGFVSANVDVSDFVGQLVTIEIGNSPTDDNLQGNVFFACFGFCQDIENGNGITGTTLTDDIRIPLRQDDQSIADFKPNLNGGSLGIQGDKDISQSKSNFELFQNQPNPFSETTMIGFNLSEGGIVNLEVFDVSGRLIYSEKGEYAKGYNQISLDRSNLPAGVLYYQVSSTTGSDSKKMILID